MANIVNACLKKLLAQYEEILKIQQVEFVGSHEIEKIINDKFEAVYSDLDVQAELFILSVADSISQYNLKKSNEFKLDEVLEAGDVKNKIKNLMHDLENLINFTSFNEEIIKHVKEAPLDKLIKFNKNTDTIEFKPFKIQSNWLYKNSKSSDLVWDKNQLNYKKKATLDNDGKTLILNSSSCWNFLCTEGSFSEGVIIFSLNLNQMVGDSHFYIGLVNENKNLQVDSGCLCCSNPNSWYYDRDGNVKANGISLDKLETTKSGNFTTKVIADFDNKTVIFEENEKQTPPLLITGTSFRFIISNCNNYTGRVTILDE